MFRNRFATVVVAATILVIFGSLSAVAAGMITSAKIKNGTIRSIDVKNGTLKMRDFNDRTRAQITSPSTPAPPASPAPAEAPIAGQYAGEDWSIIDRNVEGGGDAFLRSGPSFGDVEPPLGIGSLGIRTGSGTDKTAFGNQVDFVGQEVNDLTTVSYSVFTTGENFTKSPYNIPSITFEIDPNLAAHATNYSSLVFVSDQADPNAWTELDATDDATGFWFLTGAAGTATGCTQGGDTCTFDEVMDALDDGGDAATILTAAVTKGKDYAFSGAVDKLVINDTTYDFEPFGVSTR